ncbi:MAG: MFS transporter [Thermoproteota archaeon]
MFLKECGNRDFKGILAEGLLHQAASSMQGAIASPFFNSRGVSPSQIGVLNSVSWSIISFASMPFGRLSDFTGRRTPLIVSSILGALACILVYFATNIFTALSLYILIGFSTALFTPNNSALIFESTESSKAPLFFAVFYLATQTGRRWAHFQQAGFQNSLQHNSRFSPPQCSSSYPSRFTLSMFLEEEADRRETC